MPPGVWILWWEAVAVGAWLETFWAPKPLDIQHMVMEAAGDWPIGLAIYTLF